MVHRTTSTGMHASMKYHTLIPGEGCKHAGFAIVHAAWHLARNTHFGFGRCTVHTQFTLTYAHDEACQQQEGVTCMMRRAIQQEGVTPVTMKPG